MKKNVKKTIFSISNCIWLILFLATLYIITTYVVYHKNNQYHSFDLKNHIIKKTFNPINQIPILSYSTTIKEYNSLIQGLIYKHLNNDNIFNKIQAITYYKLGDLLSHWNPDDTSSNKWIESSCHPNNINNNNNNIIRLNYTNKEHIQLAYQYRNKEIPFILYNIPDLNHGILNTFTYQNLLSYFNKTIIVERSLTNKYMYYHMQKKKNKKYPLWTPPQKDVEMTFKDFLKYVEIADKSVDFADNTNPLYYFTISAAVGKHISLLRNALPFFTPKASSLMSDQEPATFKGINCRFGMKGVVAAAHYDGKSNFIAMIRGRKRYVLLPPEECPHLELFERGHPSARHSKIDWADIKEMTKYPDLYNAKATEVMLTMGEILYMPGNWFHYIISQDASIQCNARTGLPTIKQSKQYRSNDVCTSL